MGVQWEFNGSSMSFGLSLLLQGDAMGQWEFNGSSMGVQWEFNEVQWNSDAMGNESSMGVQSLAEAGTRGNLIPCKSRDTWEFNVLGMQCLRPVHAFARGAMYLHSVGMQWAIGIQWSSISGFPFQNSTYPIYDFRPPVSRFRFPVSDKNFSARSLWPWFLLSHKTRHHQSKFLILHAVCISNNV